MAEYIDREELLQEYDKQYEGPPIRARELIKEFPAADVKSVVHGRWIYDCSVCGYQNSQRSSYCPYCGAKMDGETNG